MFITMRTRKSLGEVRQRFEEAAAENRFAVLGIHDVGERLRAKGLTFERKFYVYEVCNPVGGEKGARHERPDRDGASVPGHDLYGRRGGRPRDLEADRDAGHVRRAFP